MGEVAAIIHVCHIFSSKLGIFGIREKYVPVCFQRSVCLLSVSSVAARRDICNNIAFRQYSCVGIIFIIAPGFFQSGQKVCQIVFFCDLAGKLGCPDSERDDLFCLNSRYVVEKPSARSEHEHSHSLCFKHIEDRSPLFFTNAAKVF